MVRKCEKAPHRKAAENVCGAEKQTGTAQKSCGECVRCGKANRHRTEKLWKKCTVRKTKNAPYGWFATEVYGDNENLICEEENL